MARLGRGLPAKPILGVGPRILFPLNLTNTAEGGTDNVEVTTANSGGASGDAWTTVEDTPPNEVVSFDNAHVMRGSMAYKLIDSGAACYVSWGPSVVGSRPELFFRVYGYFTSSAGTADPHLIAFLDASSVRRVSITLGAPDDGDAGKFKILDDSNAVVWTSTDTYIDSTFYRQGF